jgi:hypothetical protein
VALRVAGVGDERIRADKPPDFRQVGAGSQLTRTELLLGSTFGKC